MSRDYLLALEGVLPANIQPRYALISGAGQRPVAAVCMMLPPDTEVMCVTCESIPASRRKRIKPR